MFQLVSAAYAVNQIQSYDTLTINSFGGAAYPDYIVAALEKRFLEQRDIEGLCFFATSSTGSAGMGKFSDRICKEGLIREVILSFYENLSAIGKLTKEEKIAAYNFPQGVLAQLLQAAAGGRPAIVTDVGIGTFSDPRLGGGKLNRSATKDMVSLLELDGKEYLLYRVPCFDVCIIRGTTVDPKGNITFEKEAVYMDALNMAMAVKANGGKVLVQVERTNARCAHAKDVILPGILIDYVVLAPDQYQTKATKFSPYYSGDLLMTSTEATNYNDNFQESNSHHLTRYHKKEHRWIARRAAMELYQGALINLGTGIPSLVSSVARQEGVDDLVLFTVESGIIGGFPVVAPDFGVAVNAQMIYDMDRHFNLYCGRGLDLCFVGAGQVDAMGNVNVSKAGDKYIGVGGFVDITTHARKVVFCTTLTAGDGLKTSFEHKRLHIYENGAILKFVKQVEQISFSGRLAQKRGQTVLIVTERCVFELRANGLTLTEIAHGIDFARDIAPWIAFDPIIDPALKIMDSRIFSNEPLQLLKSLSSPERKS